jgi:mycothiol synthase
VIGYKRVRWMKELSGRRIYSHFGFLLPQWRGRGIGRAMLHHSERRLREIAASHPADGARLFESSAYDTQPGLDALLRSEGYVPARYFYEMVRESLDDIPEVPLPPGLEVRPAQPEHYRAIWKANVEAFRDHWGHIPPTEEDYQRWLEEPTFDPALWRVAWDGDQVAGMVLNYIDGRENTKYNRRRGYTEDVCVRRPWRRRGLARALLAQSLRVVEECGMIEAALSVDTENPNGAPRLYESVGFRAVKQETIYQKPME